MLFLCFSISPQFRCRLLWIDVFLWFSLQGLFSRITFREPVFLGGTGNITGLAKRLPVSDGMTGCIRKFVANEHEYVFAAASAGDIVQGFDIRKYAWEWNKEEEMKRAHSLKPISLFVVYAIIKQCSKSSNRLKLAIPTTLCLYCIYFRYFPPIFYVHCGIASQYL